MDEKKVLEAFMAGFDCAQVVLNSVASEIGLDDMAANKVSACFGGGMFCGGTCGAVTGAYMAIGMKYGHCQPDDGEAKVNTIKKLSEFNGKFLEQYDSLICKDLLGYDIGTLEGMEKINEQQLLTTFCPKLVSSAISILKETL